MAATADLREGHAFARRAFVLGATSLVAFVAGFGWVPFASLAAPILAFVGLGYGGRSLRRKTRVASTVTAVAGVLLSALALTAFLYILVSFTLDPPE